MEAPPAGAAPFIVELQTIPAVVYKEEDGPWGPSGTESWSFAVLVREAESRAVDLVSADVEMMSGGAPVRRVEMSRAELDAVKDRRYSGSLYRQEQLFDLQHHFSAPSALDVDRLLYTLVWEADGERMQTRLDLPVLRYEPKTDLIFPLAGPFMVMAGHAFDESHVGAWSQDFADDIVTLGDRYELMRTPEGATNEEVMAWGAEILAPAAGTVVYARNDVPDNAPGEFELRTILELPEPIKAIGGNNVVIDHGNGEFSYLGHMIQGSVRVATGDTVTQGQPLGRLGNSGSSDGPHLHYHLMDGPEIFRANSLPTRFSNVYDPIFAEAGDWAPVPNPKRGTPLVAIPPAGD